MKKLSQFWTTKTGFNSRFTSLSAAATGIVLLGIVGCGGGGGGSSSRTSPTAAPTNLPSVDPPPTPVPTVAPTPGSGGGGSNTPTDPTACNDTTYTPNYIPGFRLGTNDPNGSPGQQLRHWKSFPLNIYFIPSAENTAARKAQVFAGFNQWVTATNGVRWVETTDKSQASSVVEFTTYDPAKTGSTVGLTYSGYLTGSLELIPYNKDTASTDPNRAGYMILGFTNNAAYDQSTAAHEFGHLLGIGGHSPFTPDIMYFEGNTSGLLTPSDINTLRTGYCDNFNQGGAPKSLPFTGRVIHHVDR